MKLGIFSAEVEIVHGSCDAPATLYPEEAALCARMADARRREFAAGRAYARQALRALGVAEAPLLRGERRAPAWPEGTVGSISHSAGWCVAAAAHQRDAAGLGVDAEALRPVSARFVERVTQRAEREALGALPHRPIEEWALLLFSAKEAFYKAYFPLTRHFLGFRDARVGFFPESADAGTFHVVLARDDAPDAAGRRRFEGRYEVRAFDTLAPGLEAAASCALTGVAIPARD